MRRLALAAAVLLAVMGLSACQPRRLEIDLTVRRTAFVDLRDPKNIKVTLSGIYMCSGGSPGAPAGEPMEVNFKITQANGAIAGSETTLVCSDTPKVWTLTWEGQALTTHGTLVNGGAAIYVLAQTNPSLGINETWAEATMASDAGAQLLVAS